jgi:hypothetical protein
MPSDVFGLDVVYDRQVDSNWPEAPNYSYFFGGGSAFPEAQTHLDRLDYSTETMSRNPSRFGDAHMKRAHCMSNKNYGYTIGGQPYNTPIFVPGFSPPPVYILGAPHDTGYRIDFSTGTTNSLPTSNPLNRGSGGGAFSTPDSGYFSTGIIYNPATWPPSGSVLHSSINKFDFSSETTTGPVASLSTTNNSSSDLQTPQYGYVAGGSGGDCAIDRLQFDNETISSPTTSLDHRFVGGGMSGDDYGYLVAGEHSNPAPPPPTTFRSDMVRMDFSNETFQIPSATSPVAVLRRYASSFNKFTGYGYIAGGYQPSVTSAVQRIDVNNDTFSTPSAQLSLASHESSPVSDVGRKKTGGTDVNGVPIFSTYGYFGGGDAPGVGIVCTIDRIDFSNETVSAPSSNLTQARDDLTAVSNSNYGYFAGGATPSFVCTIDRLDFSNEITSIPSSQLTRKRNDLSSLSNSNYGYFGGGGNPLSTSTVDRIDFSNETVSEPSSDLTQARHELAAVSSSSYGYFAGGNPLRSTIDRLDFSNETIIVPPVGNHLPQARSLLFGVSDSNYGYFAGGSPPAHSTVDRLDFSNETTSAPSPELGTTRLGLSGVSNSNYGYFAGGDNPSIGFLSSFDRIEFSTETISAPANNLPQPRGTLAGVSN